MLGWRVDGSGNVYPVEVDAYNLIYDDVVNAVLGDIIDMMADIRMMELMMKEDDCDNKS